MKVLTSWEKRQRLFELGEVAGRINKCLKQHLFATYCKSIFIRAWHITKIRIMND